MCVKLDVPELMDDVDDEDSVSEYGRLLSKSLF